MMIVGSRLRMIVGRAEETERAWLFEQMRDEFLNAHRLNAARTALAFFNGPERPVLIEGRIIYVQRSRCAYVW